MSLTGEQQRQFAYEFINISNRDKSTETLASLSELTSLLFYAVEGNNMDIPIDLSEYIGELKDIANGGEDTGWKDKFKKALDENLATD